MSRIPAYVAIAATALILSACSASPQPSDPSEPDAPDQSSASTEMYGCTQGILDYIADLSYPEAEPIDPAGLEFYDSITIERVPECLVVDTSGGYERYGAFFSGDGLDAVAQIDVALDAGGYTQTDDYGPYVWWINGDEPMSAEHSVSAGPQVIEGADWMWVTY
jgi:hypothetical protein